MRDNNVIVILAVIVIAASLSIEYFPTGQNLVELALQMSIYGMIAVGLSAVLLVGYIDLSVGFQAAFATAVSVWVTNTTGSVPIAVLCAVLAGLLVGLFNGFLVTSWNIPPLIATIASTYILKGGILALTNSALAATEEGFKDIYRFSFFGQKLLSTPVLVFALALAFFGVFLSKTRKGRNLYVVGGNAEAGEYAGINTRRTILGCYGFCGFCCAAAGILIASRVGSSALALGNGLDIMAISACVIGGIKLSGGHGNMIKVLLGVAVMRLITNIMSLKALPTAWVTMITGLALVAVLLIDRFTQKTDMKG